jgi:DNA polymerase-3 subunit gamma/tau
MNERIVTVSKPTHKPDHNDDEPVNLQDVIDEQDDEIIPEDNVEESSNEPVVSDEDEPSTTTIFDQPVSEEKPDNQNVKPVVEPVAESPVVEIEDDPVEQGKDVNQTEQKEPYKTFDIRIVEAVLNDGNREEKIAMNKKWFDIERVATTDTMSLAKMITDGRIVATNGEMIIIEYPNASLCNRMMKPNIKSKVVDMLSDYFKKPLDYLALPKSVWGEKSIEFITKWKENPDRYITLSEIDHPRLKEIPVIKQDHDTMEHKGVKEASRLYGKHKVKVKRGE